MTAAAPEGVFGEGSSGQGGAEGNTGRLTWRYEFALPQARGQAQPQLSITYSSSSRDREAGYGWGLNLPVIERTPLSGYPCADASGRPMVCGAASPAQELDEHYSYSGQPLVQICTLPQAPQSIPAACGPEAQPDWALTGGWRYFRLQVEGQFARFYLSDSRRLWKVQLKGGETLEFGDLSGGGRGTETDADNPRSVLRWRLVRAADALHLAGGQPRNFVSYRWAPLGRRGLLFLTDIYDTPRADGRAADADFAHHVTLAWRAPDFAQTHYADPFRATPDLILSRVTVASSPWSGEGRREIVRTYFLTYRPAQGPVTAVPLDQVFLPWHHSFLSQIELQGRCGLFEGDEQGIAVQRACRAAVQPATTFEYEDGTPTFGVASLPQTKGGPAGAYDRDEVLRYVSSTGIVDVNQDGLPDVAQGWNPDLTCATVECDEARPLVAYLNRGVGLFATFQYTCFDAGRRDDTTGLNHYGAGAQNGFFAGRGGATLVTPRSEGILAWSNAGFAPYRARPVVPEYRLDLSEPADLAGVPTAGAGNIYAARIGGRIHLRIFNTAGVEVFDRAAAPILPPSTIAALDAAFDTPLPAADLQALSDRIVVSTPYFQPYEAGVNCDSATYDPGTFKPAWKWEKTQSTVDWAKPPVGEDDHNGPAGPGHGPFGNLPRWYVDVDADGLVDRFNSTGIQAFDFETAYVEFTRRYARGQSLPGVGGGPAEIAFVPDFSGTPRSLAPSFAGSQSGTRYWYVDTNGDGLVDLVTYNAGQFGGVPQVRPGNGRGEFTCIDVLQPWPCQETPQDPARHFGIAVVGSATPWPFNDDTNFQDVTGDGLADIVRYDMQSGEVRLWVNQDGHDFACISASCVVGKVINPHAAERGLSGAAAWDVGPHRTTFADMDGDGVEDLVVLSGAGISVGRFMHQYVADGGPFHGFAPHPGLLIRIRNGYGASTDIQYRSIQALDLAAAADPETAWIAHVPVVDSVVTQITAQDSRAAGDDPSGPVLAEPYGFRRVLRYVYRDPAYDRWSRAFSGFRTVISRVGDEASTTATTYWYGPCQNNRLNARLDGAPDIPLCTGGSDSDPLKSVSGRAVRIDRGTGYLGLFPTLRTEHEPAPAGPGPLWSQEFHYVTDTLFTMPERDVTFTYAAQVDTYLYDDALPAQEPALAAGQTAGADLLLDAARQPGHRRHLREGTEYDRNGTLRRSFGRRLMRDPDSAPADLAEPLVVTLMSDADPQGATTGAAPLHCTADWVCSPRYASLWQVGPSGVGPDTLLRKSQLTFTPAFEIASVANWLDRAADELQRHHPGGAGAFAAAAPGAALARGWHVALNAQFDAFGNVLQLSGESTPGGSPAACTDYAPDRVFAQFVERTVEHVRGCGDAGQQRVTTFDRGFGQPVSVTGPDGTASEIRYDPFGRLSQVLAPDPDAPPGAPLVLAAAYDYHDAAPLSYAVARQIVGPGAEQRSYTVMNGLGEAVLHFNWDDGATWILDSWRETDLEGHAVRGRAPWAVVTDPVTSIAAAAFFAVPTGNIATEVKYDAFGRRASVSEVINGTRRDLQQFRYQPLAVEVRDAEQLDPASPHRNAFQRQEFDGLGRIVLDRMHIGSPGPDNIDTRVEYAPTGEPLRISRRAAGANTQRTMTYDTLGRLMLNSEPNSGNNWRYVWDDAGRLVGTSDARGCGENFTYDGMNRVVGEDYSPCLAAQPAYTAADPATGTGLEVRYQYDSYEPGQIHSEPGFADDARFATGRLVSISDRGSRTRFNYDARGRLRRESRALGLPGNAGADRYSPHWYETRTDYDIADRPVRRTSGADLPEFLVGGSSDERYGYSVRGYPSTIDSAYGQLVAGTEWDAFGAATRVVFGDARQTTASYTYDEHHRLNLYQLLAFPRPGLQPIGYFDYRFPSYDAVGNPLEVQDARIAWTALPPEAATIESRRYDYDDLYRVAHVGYTYKTADGSAPFAQPFGPELAAGDTRPVPMQDIPTRIRRQSFGYDGIGRLIASNDDKAARFDRSTGPGLIYGPDTDGPDQLRSGPGLAVGYDAAGDMTSLRLVREATCAGAPAGPCSQWFAYDWDEVGHLIRARRWDYAATPPATLPGAGALATRDVSYAYSSDSRVMRASTDSAGHTVYGLEIFDSLRADGVPFDSGAQDYRTGPENLQVYLAGLAHAYWDASGILPHQSPGSRITMHLIVADQLGANAVVINHATSQLVEQTSYLGNGAIESDYRAPGWQGFRENYGFTGKEADIEVGLVNFGARYYQPNLGRFISPDPLALHALRGDLNSYAYVQGRISTMVDPTGMEESDATIVFDDDYITGKRPSAPAPAPEPVPLPTPAPEPTAAPGQPEPPAAAAPRDLSIIDRAQAYLGTEQGQRVKAAVTKSLGQAALNIIDPTHVNRAFVADIATVADTKASTTSRAVAGGSAVLSVIPLAGELRIASRVGRALAATRTSAELASIISRARVWRGGQTVAVLETVEGTRLVGGGRADLNPVQRMMAVIFELVPVKAAGYHAEYTVVNGAKKLGLTPLRGVTTIEICEQICQRDLTEGAYGWVFEIIDDFTFVLKR